MSHSILTILTTSAVVLHALLGCCAHHAHSCDSHQHGVACVDVACVDHDGLHGDCHADRDAATSDGSSGHSDGERQHHHESCVESDCSYVSAEGCDDVMLALSLAVWSPTMGDSVIAPVFLESLCQLSGTECPPDHLLSPEPLRAQTQVWLL